MSYSPPGTGGSGTGAVDSVFGRTGAVVAQAGDYSATMIAFTPVGGIAAATVQAAIAELDSEKISSASAASVFAAVVHNHDAVSISYSAGGGIAATNVQDALDELDVEKLSSASAAAAYAAIGHNHDAASVSYSANGSIAATNVQDALDELDAEKLSSASAASVYVVGPAASTDNALARFDGTGGKTLHNSGVTLNDNGEMVLAAGGAADAPLKFTSGTNLTTAEDGAVEFDGTCFYMTTDDGNRGVNLIEHFIRAASSRTLTSTTSEQALFNSPANGRLTLETGTYFFEALFSLSGMSGTSGNAAFDILGAGSATLANVLYHAVGIDGAVNAAGTQTGSTSNAGQSPASIVTAGTATAMQCSIRGTFQVNAAGTIVPSVTLVTAAAATLAAGSYFRCRRVGASGVASVGQWD
jgi:hypothetical protein